MLIGIVDFEKKKRQNSAEHYWFEHLKHFVNFFSYKSLNGANDCCCCMLICTKIDFVGLPKYWLKDPSICIFICLYCTNLKFEYWVISIQRLGVIVVELVSKRDCKRSDFANCNQKKKKSPSHYEEGHWGAHLDKPRWRGFNPPVGETPVLCQWTCPSLQA